MKIYYYCDILSSCNHMINYICEGIPGQTGISGNPGAPGIPGVDGCNGTDGNFSFDIFLFHAELENS